MLFGIFGKMQDRIERKVSYNEPGLYVSLTFPILAAFLLTFAFSRLIGYLITYGYMPAIYLQTSPGVHVHHFTYGFFILAVAAYLALVFNGPKAKYLISLLLGFGLGLAMDEFGMWLKLRDDGLVRWNYDGFIIVIASFLILISFRRGISLMRLIWPKKYTPDNPSH